LQAADKAIGASSVKSFTLAAHGRGWATQASSFATGDLPRSDLKSYNLTEDLASKSAKTEYVRVQGNQPIRGGGAGFPVRGEVSFTEFVAGDLGWNLNPQASPFRFWRGTPRIASSASGSTRRASSRLPWRTIMRRPPTATSPDKTAPSRSWQFTTKVCDRPQPQCTRRVTGEFNNDNMLERVVTWFTDPVLGDKMVELRWSDYRDVGGG